jgi:hypothetical protein
VWLEHVDEAVSAALRPEPADDRPTAEVPARRAASG